MDSLIASFQRWKKKEARPGKALPLLFFFVQAQTGQRDVVLDTSQHKNNFAVYDKSQHINIFAVLI
jgi:hypothetical protein